LSERAENTRSSGLDASVTSIFPWTPRATQLLRVASVAGQTPPDVVDHDLVQAVEVDSSSCNSRLSSANGRGDNRTGRVESFCGLKLARFDVIDGLEDWRGTILKQQS